MRRLGVAVALLFASACAPTGLEGEAANDSEPAAQPMSSVNVSSEHVREACGTWQDILDVATDASNFFADNLDETVRRTAEMHAELASTANRSGNPALAEAAAEVRRFNDRSDRAATDGQQLPDEDWDAARDAGDVLISECEAFGIPIRDSRMPRESLER